jgi:hypothetical protein
MSDRELSRLEVLRDLAQKRLTTKMAGQLLRLEPAPSMGCGLHKVCSKLSTFRFGLDV